MNNRRNFCRFCGKPLEEDSTFCTWCGKKLTDDQSQKRTVSSSLVRIRRNKKALVICFTVIVFVGVGGFLFLNSSLGSSDSKKEQAETVNAVSKSEKQEKKEDQKTDDADKEEKEVAKKKDDKAAESDSKKSAESEWKSYILLYNMNVRKEPDIASEKLDLIENGKIVDVRNSLINKDGTWAELKQGGWICLKDSDLVYLEKYDPKKLASRMNERSFEDYALDFDDGWIVISDGRFGFLRSDGTFKIDPDKTEAIIYPADKSSAMKACLTSSNQIYGELREGTVEDCNVADGGGGVGRTYINENNIPVFEGIDGVKELSSSSTGSRFAALENKQSTSRYIYDFQTSKIYGPYEMNEPASFTLQHVSYNPSLRENYHIALNGLFGIYKINSPFYDRTESGYRLHGLDSSTLDGFDEVKIISPNGAFAKKNGKGMLLDQNLITVAAGDYDFISCPVNGMSLARKGNDWMLIRV